MPVVQRKAQRRAFVDPVTRVLTAHGYVAANGADVAVDVPEDFAKEPGAWRLGADGATWVALAPPVVPDVPAFMAQVRDWFLAQGDAGQDRLDALLRNAPTLFDAVRSMAGLPQSHAAWARVRRYWARVKVREGLTADEVSAVEMRASACNVPLV